MLGHDAEKSNFEGIQYLLLHKLKITYMIKCIGWLKKTGSRKGMYNYRHVYFIIIDFFFFFGCGSKHVERGLCLSKVLFVVIHVSAILLFIGFFIFLFLQFLYLQNKT